MNNPSDTYIAIGDVHGCAASLEALLKRATEQWGTGHCWVFLGDYTDRGPESKAVVDRLIDFQSDHHCVFIRGNHDQMLLDAYRENKWRMWLQNGGEETLQSYESEAGAFKLPEEHLRFFEETKLWHETDKYLFVHGGMNPRKSIAENLKDSAEQERFMWQRDHIDADTSGSWEKTVVFGHTPVSRPLIEANQLGLDTGCVYKRRQFGVLTATLLPAMDFIAQTNID